MLCSSVQGGDSIQELFASSEMTPPTYWDNHNQEHLVGGSTLGIISKFLSQGAILCALYTLVQPKGRGIVDALDN